MPRPATEVPLYWKCASKEDSAGGRKLDQLYEKSSPGPNEVSLSSLETSRVEPDGTHVVRCRKIEVDISNPSPVPRGVENLDLHALVDLHKRLEDEQKLLPGELLIGGRVSGLATKMLIDTGASVSVVSTALWQGIHDTHPGWTLLPTTCQVRTVSGDLGKVRGSLVVEIELNGQYYAHKFIVMDIAEDLILGLDFIQKYDLNWNKKRGSLVLRGQEVQTLRRYSMGDAHVRRLRVAEVTVIPPRTQQIVEVKVCQRGPGNLPDWGMVSATRATVRSHGVIAGRALVDPTQGTIPIPVMNPGENIVILPRNLNIALLSPALTVGPSPAQGVSEETSSLADRNHMATPDSDMAQRAFRPEVESVPMSGTTSSLESDGDLDGTPTAEVEEEEFIHLSTMPGCEDPIESSSSPVQGQGRVRAATIPAGMVPPDFSSDTEFPSRRHWSSDSEPESPEPVTAKGSMRKDPVPKHLMKLYEDSVTHISTSEAQRLADFLNLYADVFAATSNDMGRTDLVQHTIDTGKAYPIMQGPRRVPVHKKHIVQEEVDKMLQKGVIEPSNGQWSSPIVLVTKKDGTTRFCVDYRRLNDVTRKDAYPLPRIEDNLDALQGSKYFSTLDLLTGFWQVEVAPQDRDKTAFTVGGDGQYRFLTMPFGLCNAPGTFQRLMEQVLQGLQWEIAVLYIDDVVVFSSTLDQHLERLAQVFDRFRAAGLKLKPSKCSLLQKKVEFLGHVVSEEGVAVDPSKVAKIQAWPQPQCVRDVRSFVGLCAYYRRFVPEFSTVCKPLFVLTEKDQPFVWGTAQQTAMAKLKQLLGAAPVLAYPRPRGQYILDCRSNVVGLGAVLSQVQDGKEKVLSNASKVLNQAQRNYCVVRRELLALVESLKQFHHYLYGVRFLVRTTQAALFWLLRKKNPEGQMARWISLLQEYDMIIEHCPRPKHGTDDAYSKCGEGCRDADGLEIPAGATETMATIQNKAQAELCWAAKGTSIGKTIPRAVPAESKVVRQVVETTSASNTSLNAQSNRDKQTPLPRVAKSTSSELVEGGQFLEETVQDDSTRASLVEGAHTLLNLSTKSSLVEGVLPRRHHKPTVTPTRVQQTSSPIEVKTETLVKQNPTVSKRRRNQRGPRKKAALSAQPPLPPTARKLLEDGKTVDKGSGGRNSSNDEPADARATGETVKSQLQQLDLPSGRSVDWDVEAIICIQDHDPTLSRVKAWKKCGKVPTDKEVASESHEIRAWWAELDRLSLAGGQLLTFSQRSDDPNRKSTPKVAATEAMIEAILQELHEPHVGGHSGSRETIKQIRSGPYHWPGMVESAKQWVSNCSTCIGLMLSRHASNTSMHLFRVEAPLDWEPEDCIDFFPSDMATPAKPLERGDAVWLRVCSTGTYREPREKNHWTGPWFIIREVSSETFLVQKDEAGKPKRVHSYHLKRYGAFVEDAWVKILRGETPVNPCENRLH